MRKGISFLESASAHVGIGDWSIKTRLTPKNNLYQVS
jgi:hypothetical protein